MPTFEHSKPPHRGSAVIDFHDLMRFRVMDILLVASPYDTFLLEEAGQLAERQAGEYRSLDVHYEPRLTGVTRGSQALELLRDEPDRFDMVVSTVRVSDMDVTALARRVHELRPDVPVMLLAFDAQEMKHFVSGRDVSDLERLFVWQGDARILQAIVKCFEDRRNVEHDTKVGVQVILLVEDSVRRYSSFLPVLYDELLRQSQRLLPDTLNSAHKIARMRARPKVLLCTTFEEAWEAFERYTDAILGVISDIEFPRAGHSDPEAGFELARRVRRARYGDVPVILHSSHDENEARARRLDAGFLPKGSPQLLDSLRTVLTNDFCFGDFVFRCEDNGPEQARAGNLRALEEGLRRVPPASVAYHAERNHFSRWLKARTEFTVAELLRPRRVCDYDSVEELRAVLIEAIERHRAERSALSVADFDRESFDASGFHRIGGGSLGGKARGLAFARRLLASARVSGRFDGVAVDVPPCAVLATGVFEQFLKLNDLGTFAVECQDDAEIERRFLAGRFPDEALRDVEAFVAKVRWPLAVRSSSLLEDSQYQPFTGVYATYMLPNLHPSPEVRLRHLLQAVQRVYASTFSRQTKSYLHATPYRLEEERMAVILQRLVGIERNGRFYPDCSGVARSHNFYPTPPLAREDGVVALALGLGRTVVEGGNCLRFSPRHPRHLMSFSSVDDVLKNSQRDFWALELREAGGAAGLTLMSETRFDLAAAEDDGVLALVGSTYSRDNHAVYDGVSRSGLRVVTFAPILKHGAFPLPEIVAALLELAEEGVAAPVELEFAVNLTRREFAFLQMRPLAMAHEDAVVDLSQLAPECLVCRSEHVLGGSRVEGLHDVVVVDAARFERGRSQTVAQDLALLNARLMQAGVGYLLVGVGRWGSRDPWLGIPVSWDQIAGARAIVEAGFRDMRVTPSQGSHFFQNLTSFDVAYFTVNPDLGDGFVDWDWLRAQPALHEAGALRHLRFDEPVVVRLHGPRREGVILKPGS